MEREIERGSVGDRQVTAVVSPSIDAEGPGAMSDEMKPRKRQKVIAMTDPPTIIETFFNSANIQSDDKRLIFSWNLNGMVPTLSLIEYHFKSLNEWLKALSVDIICFQETKLTAKTFTGAIAVLDDFESFHTLCQKRPGYSGVATYVRKSSQYFPVAAASEVFSDADLNEEGRVMMTDHRDFVLFNVYVPNAGAWPERKRVPYKLRFLKALKNAVAKFVTAGRKVIIAGDINIPATDKDAGPSQSKRPHFGYSIEETEWFSELQKEMGLVDVWRRANPSVTGAFTCWNQAKEARHSNDGVRIDYFLASSDWSDDRRSAVHILNTPDKWSDHAGILLTVRREPSLVPLKEQALPALASSALPKFKRQFESIKSFFKPK